MEAIFSFGAKDMKIIVLFYFFSKREGRLGLICRRFQRAIQVSPQAGSPVSRPVSYFKDRSVHELQEHETPFNQNKIPKYWHYAGCVGFLQLQIKPEFSHASHIFKAILPSQLKYCITGYWPRLFPLYPSQFRKIA